MGHLLRRKAVESGLLPIGGAGKARILMYHGVGEDGCHRRNVRHISQRVLARQLMSFTEHFHVVPLEAIFAGERHPKKLTVALTFDDGHRNNLTHALPVLEQARVPASFFITGANPCGLPILWGDLLDLAERHTDRELHIDGLRWQRAPNGRYAHGTKLLRDHIKEAGGWPCKQALYDQLRDVLDGPLQGERIYWELMSDDELHRFAQHALVHIGSHGWWHNDMGRIPLAEALMELRLSMDHLQRITGEAMTSLAWPDGSYSMEAVAGAAALGLTKQLAVNYAHPTDAQDGRLWDRYGIYDFPTSDRWLLHLIARGAA